MSGTYRFVSTSHHTICWYIGTVRYVLYQWSVGTPVRTSKVSHDLNISQTNIYHLIYTGITENQNQNVLLSLGIAFLEGMVIIHLGSPCRFLVLLLHLSRNTFLCYIHLSFFSRGHNHRFFLFSHNKFKKLKSGTYGSVEY